MQWKLDEMLETQQKVNDKVREKLDNQPAQIDYLLAMQVEVFELINAIGTWKWWKHSHVPNKAKILDELADVMAFFFSYVLILDDDVRAGVPKYLSETYEEFMKYEVQEILSFITASINDGRKQNAVILMSECVALVGKSIGANWIDIEEAYAEKSKVNIQRQVSNY